MVRVCEIDRRPSIANANGQPNPRSMAYSEYTRLPQNQPQYIGFCPIAREILLISCLADDRRLGCLSTLLVSNFLKVALLEKSENRTRKLCDTNPILYHWADNLRPTQPLPQTRGSLRWQKTALVWTHRTFRTLVKLSICVSLIHICRFKRSADSDAVQADVCDIRETEVDGRVIREAASGEACHTTV